MSYGTTRWTDKKTGKQMSKNGPMYIHFSEHCLRKFDNKKFYAQNESFAYSVITPNQITFNKLNGEERNLLRKLGLKFYLTKHLSYCKVFLIKLNKLA